MQYHVLPGNTADCTTPVANIDAVVQFLARPDLATLAVRPLIVSDCKMVTDAAVLARLRRATLTYLGPLAPGEERTQAIIRSVPDAELAANELAYRSASGRRRLANRLSHIAASGARSRSATTVRR